jgi:hypothetical protein
MGTPSDRHLPGLPIFTLRLGAVKGKRPVKATVAGLIGRHVRSFSLTPCDGYFQGAPDPGWAIMVAHADHETIATLAEALRVRFAQEGIGVEAYGRYLRCRADRGVELLKAELLNLGNAKSVNLQPCKP